MCSSDLLHALRHPDVEPDAPFTAAFEAEITPILRGALRDPEQAFDEYTAFARARVARETKCRANEVPEDVARALAVTSMADWNADPIARETIARAVPWIAAADASELFVPRAWAPSLEYTPERMLAIARSAVTLVDVPAPVRRDATPERNERCACGSGQKYKRCCMRAPMRVAA